MSNLFDDQDDRSLDDDVEDWMGREPGVAWEKARRVAMGLRSLGHGRGPDLIGVLEVENRRALEMLRSALNDGLPEAERYVWVVHRDDRTGRRIEPAWISRVRIEPGLPTPRRRGGSRRILEVSLDRGRGRPIHLILSHWTSRRQADSAGRRAGYARQLRARLDELRARDRDVAVVLAGDFNEERGSPVLRILTEGAGLVDLLGGIEPERRATLVYRGRGYGFDHLWATRSAVEGVGWRVDAGSAEVLDGPPFREPGRPEARPWRFGGAGQVGERGYSDHFPLVFRLVPAGAVPNGSG